MEHNFSDFCMEEHPQVRAYNNGFESLTVVELISMIIGTVPSAMLNKLVRFTT